MSTQPYQSPDLETQGASKDPSLEPVAEDTARRLVEGAEQQVGAGEQGSEQDQAQQRGAEAPSPAVSSAADRNRDMPGAAEAEDRDQPDQPVNDDDEATELDDALGDSFPASDPPAQTTKGRVK